MSGVEESRVVETRSKIKLSRNAKGDAQWEITIVEDASPDEIERLRQLAIAQHRALTEALT